jgi:hypothetical protein
MSLLSLKKIRVLLCGFVSGRFKKTNFSKSVRNQRQKIYTVFLIKIILLDFFNFYAKGNLTLSVKLFRRIIIPANEPNLRRETRGQPLEITKSSCVCLITLYSRSIQSFFLARLKNDQKILLFCKDGTLRIILI